jgi:hypothetical protein
MKSIKNVDAVVEKVAEQKKVDKEKIKTQVKTIIAMIKKKNKKDARRFGKYSWDDENFLLTSTE